MKKKKFFLHQGNHYFSKTVAYCVAIGRYRPGSSEPAVFPMRLATCPSSNVVLSSVRLSLFGCHYLAPVHGGATKKQPDRISW